MQSDPFSTFLSFPDTNSHLSGDTPFPFRFPSAGSPSNYYYGFAFFRQRKDDTIKRGYMQKAVALISDHPYFALFGQVMSQVAPTFFSNGAPVLEACWSTIAAWPSDPHAKAAHELPLLGSTLHFRTPELPSLSQRPPLALAPLLTCALPPRQELTACLQGINLYTIFHTLHSSLWIIWELVLLGEPLLVLGTTPPVVTQAVLALTSLIWPLGYTGDFRPFFNIHSDAFRTLQATKATALPSVILGVTNPFILKTLKGWPHVLNLPEPPGTTIVAKGVAGKASPSPVKDSVVFASSYEPVLQPDKEVVQHLSFPRAESTIGAAAANNELIRAHFMQRTLVFLTPLEEYATQAFNSAWRRSTPFVCAPIATFVAADFLTWYRAREANKPGADRRLILMERFMRCGNFAGWLTDRLREDEARLRDLQGQAIRTLSSSIRSRTEVEKIDVLITCKAAQKRPGMLPVPVGILQEQMALILEQLPADLRKSLEKPID